MTLMMLSVAMKMNKKEMKALKEELTDQGWQILYFEAAMSNEDKAHKALLERLDNIYWTGYNQGMEDAVNSDDLGGSY
jgi:hypothetical protein